MPRWKHRGLRSQVFSDTYHWLIGLGWAQIFSVVLVGFVVFNGVFAWLYQAGGDCYNATDPSSFLQAFSFSVQTMCSIGYGAMSPTTPYAHVLSIVEGFLSLLAIAMTTGLMFAKFARPVAKVGFAQFAVIDTMNGKPVLKIRMSNLRHNQVVDARVHAVAFIDTVTTEGERFRRLHDLILVRQVSPVFALSWTLLHEIDEASPFFGAPTGELDPGFSGLLINFVGLDDTFSQSVHAQGLYRREDIRVGYRYREMITTQADGTLEIDHTRLHDIEST